LFVGPEATLFRVHKKILCDKVPYFDKMFNGGFLEATEMKAILPEDDPVVYGLLLEWVYSGCYAKLDIKDHTSSSGPFIERIKLYAFAEKICLVPLMDYTMTTLISNYHHHMKALSDVAMLLAYKLT
jgi:hypothetical protein